MSATTSPAGLHAAADEFAGTAFLVHQILARLGTAALAQVKAVTNSGGISPVGFVDIQPMVNMVDGAGNATPHGVIHGVPYLRLQGGSNALILDPQVGDIGIAVFASRDISSVVANRAPANPGSLRRFDMADGLYLGGCLNGTPVQYVAFSSSGIALTSPTQITMTAPTIALNGTVAATGALTSNGVDISSTHVHGGVQTGGGNTGVPIT